MELTVLPFEILEMILKSPCISHLDLLHVACTCSTLYQTASSNDIWKAKFQQRWPQLYKRYKSNPCHKWKEEFITRQRIGSHTRRTVKSLPGIYHRKGDLPNEVLSRFDSVNQSEHIIDELLNLCNDGQSALNLTNKYYASKLLRLVQQNRLKNELRLQLLESGEDMSLEKGAVLISQWINNTEVISENSISDQLDHIADLVWDELKKQNDSLTSSRPPFPISETTLNEGSKIRCDQLKSRHILETLNFILYKKLGFNGNIDDYYNPANSCIDKVLESKRGIPITLSIIYIAVASRLGVTCLPVNFPTHFLIKWEEHPGLPQHESFTYIDAFRNGKFMNEAECADSLSIPFLLTKDNYNAVTPFQVLKRMIGNLVAIGKEGHERGHGELLFLKSVELLHAIHPRDLDITILLAKLYLHMKINITEVIQMMQMGEHEGNVPVGLCGQISERAQEILQNEAQKGQINVKRRSDNPEVIYSVGMIMKHRRYDYFCVIRGWDHECTASVEWVIRMGVHLLSKQNHQPFYKVLVDDGTTRYAAQESLDYAPECKMINHPEVGRYMETYCGLYYVANEETQKKYPDDLDVTKKLSERHSYLA